MDSIVTEQVVPAGASWCIAFDPAARTLEQIPLHMDTLTPDARTAVAAAARTGLIPVIGTWHWNGNHVWNAVWWDGAWHPYQVDRWYGPTRIDLPEIGEDRLYNSEGGRDVSIIWSERADGLPVSSTELYSHTCRIVIDVTDTTGRPADGCKVFLVSECQFGGLNGITCGTTNQRE